MKQALLSTCIWLSAHPAFCILVLWPVLTAAVNLAWKDASEYALTHPRFAAAKKLAQKWGLSPRGTILLLAKAIGIAPPPPTDPDDSGSFGKLSAGIVPPPAPTKPDLGLRVRMLAAALFALLLSLPLVGIIACGTPAASPVAERDQARAAILTIAEAVKTGDAVCAQAALSLKKAPLAKGCADAYDDARSSLLVAESSIDAWEQGEAGNVACAGSHALQAVVTIENLLASNGVAVPAVVQDAVKLGQMFLPLCAPSPVDGGADE